MPLIFFLDHRSWTWGLLAHFSSLLLSVLRRNFTLGRWDHKMDDKFITGFWPGALAEGNTITAGIFMSISPPCKRIYYLCRWGKKVLKEKRSKITWKERYPHTKSIVHGKSETLPRALFWHPESKSLEIPNVSRNLLAEHCCLYSSESLAWVQSKNESETFWCLGSPYVDPAMYPGILAETVFYCKTLKPT